MRRGRYCFGAALVVTMTTLASVVQAAVPPAVPQGVQAFPGTGAVLVTFGGVPGATGYNVYRHERSQTADKAVKVNAEPTPHTWAIDQGLTNGTPLVYSVKAVLPSGEGAASTEVSVTPQVPVLPGWYWHDISTLNPGRVTLENDVLSIRASGDDIWDVYDGQTFFAAPVAGDYSISFQVMEKPVVDGPVVDEGNQNFGKVGVQIREGLEPGDRYAYLFASVQRSPTILYETRVGIRGAAGSEGVANPGQNGPNETDDFTFPIWLRLNKTSSEDSPPNALIEALWSSDGTNWTSLGDPINFGRMKPVTYAGIAATAHSGGGSAENEAKGMYVSGKIKASTIKFE